MSTFDFKTHIKNIRKEALEIGFSISTISGYQKIWNKFIKWKNNAYFTYNSDDYSEFLFEQYNFDIKTYTNNSKPFLKQLIRSKKILEDFDLYKQNMLKRVLPQSLYSNFPKEWLTILNNYLNYCKDVNINSKNTIKIKQDYLKRILSYFYQNKIIDIKDIKKEIIIKFINESSEKGNVSKRRNFYVLREFLKYLFIEDILKEDLSIYIPKIKSTRRKKIPTYLKPNEIEELLKNIPRIRKVDIRNYTIILIAARLGLRINDILNIKLKDIDWKNYKINVTQSKNNNLNVLPLSKELGWAIIDYIKNARPNCNNEYLFVKMKYPFNKMNSFQTFNKYFDKIDIETNIENKKGIHNLRHSLATNMLNNDIPLNIIASTLGDTCQTISSTYLKVDINNLKECALEVDE